MNDDQARSLLRILARQQLGGILVAGLPNVRYLSGYTGSDATLWITRRGRTLFTDSRYTTQAQAEAPDFKVIEYRQKTPDVAQAILRAHPRRIGFESARITHVLYLDYHKRLPGVRLVPLGPEFELLRARKRADEIACLKKAGEIARRALEATLPLLRPGVREREVALELEHLMRHLGAEQAAFPTIVASGKRGALPHGVASAKKLRAGELVTIDYGCTYRGYASDQTVTFCLGRPKPRQREIYETVCQAQERAVAAVRAGAELKAVDALARDFIREQGYGRYFGHGLGHGVGLEVHEAPALNPRARGTLEVGMVVTIEPGIYVPGYGGVRIEDMVEVTAKGSWRLTHSGGPLRMLPI